MDTIEPILSVAHEIYALVEKVKANKKRCCRVSQRVRALEDLVQSVRQRQTVQDQDQVQDHDKDLVQDGAQVERALQELHLTLQASRELIRKYTAANWVQRVLQSGSHGDDFDSVNDRLNDAFQVLSGALQVEQGNVLHRVFEQTSRDREDKLDRLEDDGELKTLLLDHMRIQEERTAAMLKDFQEFKVNVGKIVSSLEKPSVVPENIRIIKSKELKYEQNPLMTTPTSEIYKGEFSGFPVAIKRYLDPQSTDPSVVERVFKKEVDTMRCFESPNILRMFGICIQKETTPNPEFLIIMEFCEKGSLRQVLDSDQQLSWSRRVRMSLDAAQGLYRLHQTEEKTRVHGCLTSSKFLVADGYRVKLGGFELSKTETSLRKPSKDGEKRLLSYCSPQILDDINQAYSKECEIYSLGVVLWEVATFKKPFEGCSNEDIFQKVCEEKQQEPLPDDCPVALEQLVTACRLYDAFRRPSAGVLVDKLRKVVETLED